MKDVKILEKRIGDKNQKDEKLGGIFFNPILQLVVVYVPAVHYRGFHHAASF